MQGASPKARRLGAVGLIIALAMALGACMLSPGKFAAQLDMRKSGDFRFSYTGEIHVLALSKLAESMHGKAGEVVTFTSRPCLSGEDDKERVCTTEEIAEQKKEWDDQQRTAGQRQAREIESMKAMFGGIDPADPRAAEELATRLRRQAGWRRVVHRGDGLFDIEFVIEGRLDHDFAFPTIERFPSANPFVQVMRRADGTARIDAPGFAPAAAGEPYRGWMQAAAVSEGSQRAPRLPEMDGTFVVITDAEVLANNTDLGPQASTTGQRLEWKVNSRSQAAPTALLRLAR